MGCPDPMFIIYDMLRHLCTVRYIFQGHGEVDQFDTTITGPYMEMWKIVGHNKHLAQFLDEKSKQ